MVEQASHQPVIAPGAPLTGAEPLAVYLHIPFCQVRCAYCDFNTYAGLNDLIEPYTRALAQEMRLVGQAGGRPRVHTIFFGGGTPSLLPLAALAQLLAALRHAFDLTPDCEITLEANPGTVQRDYFVGLHHLGVNRLSLGVQSSHPHELRLLDRAHLFGDVAQAVTWARAAGFERLNLDLIYALPHQTLAQWQATLHRTLGLGPDHISAYALSLEHGTPMRAWVQRGLLAEPDPDLAADMYAWTAETLAAHGFDHYEISNWANGAGQACRHNLQYWRNRPYLGLGAGAHGYADGTRYANVLAPAVFIQRVANGAPRPFPLSPAVATAQTVSAEEAMNDTVLLGLRLLHEGVNLADFAARHGVSALTHFGKTLRRLHALQLLTWDEATLRLTPAGRFVSNRVFSEFV